MNNPNYFNVFLLIFILIITGIYNSFIINKGNKKFEISLITLMVLSYIFALGSGNNNIFSPINEFMYNYFPFYKGFREPHKWTIFLVIGYSYFGAYGIKYIYNFLKFDNITKKIIFSTISIIPILYSPIFLWGFNNQIKVKNYPIEWNEVKSFINNDKNNNCIYLKEKISKNCYNTISFPRHSYIGISWLGKIVGGWIVQYFGDHILISDNIEIRNIYSSSNRQESKIIEIYIGPNGIFRGKYDDNNIKSFINDLKGLGIRNIILLKESDYDFYIKFLDIIKNKGMLKIEKENKMVKIYKIN
ncbi:MAG: hypothetical protein PHG82_05650 [Candidatus Gracilibacteria bacterium]|nr:hypothetical protein [Candidatus Gracilibacteria bacterium]